MSEKKEKDFLDQFAQTDKPESFQEEKRVPIQKAKFTPNWKGIGISAVVLIALCVGIYFLFFAAKIEMPDFVGKNRSEVATWVRQQGITASGVVMRDEFSLEYDRDVIMQQSVAAGSKVKKDVKLNFVVSKGADPAESVAFPDIQKMSREEITNWIQTNKLAKTKVNSIYSDTVEEGKVIDYDLKGDSASFTRGSSLTINISKGKEPSKQVTVTDFGGKTLQNVAEWAATNKVKVEKVEQYDNHKQAGEIIATSPAKGSKIDQGATLTVYISKGKGVMVPNLAAMDKAQIEIWKKKNKVNIESIQKYSNLSSSIISQDPVAGTMIGEGETIVVVENLGNTFTLQKLSGELLKNGTLVGVDYQAFVEALNDARATGIDAYANNWTAGKEIYSQEFSRGQIVSAQCTGHSNNQRYACNGPLPLDARFDVVISKGKVWDLPAGSDITIDQWMKELSSRNITFKLDKNITSKDYSEVGELLLDGTKADKLYEDREYLITKK